MNKRYLYVGFLIALALAAIALSAGSWGSIPSAHGAPLAQGKAPDQPDAASGTLVLQYSAKFVCTASMIPGVPFYGKVAPVVYQNTEILVHNPNDYPIHVYKKAVLASEEDASFEVPSPWHIYPDETVNESPLFEADYAFRIDCDDIVRLLTGDLSATFNGNPAYPPGTTIEGYVVLAVGPEEIAVDDVRYPQLNVTAEYTRGSEVLKKDIFYQPWWIYWPTDTYTEDFPWILGFPYERIIKLTISSPDEYDWDCPTQIYAALQEDLDLLTDVNMVVDIENALIAGIDHYLAAKINNPGIAGVDFPGGLVPEVTDPALIVLTSHCDKIFSPSGALYMDASYVIVSNWTPNGTPIYPWIPGRWYDMPVVIPQNTTMDLDYMFHYWHAYLWSDYIGNSYTPEYLMDNYLADYFFPYWSGLSSKWWSYNGPDSIDIGVGEGESIDVEQITPLRVIYTGWEPTWVPWIAP